jgi:hypothetical protein
MANESPAENSCSPVSIMTKFSVSGVVGIYLALFIISNKKNQHILANQISIIHVYHNYNKIIKNKKIRTINCCNYFKIKLLI